MRSSVPLKDAYRLINHGPTTLVTTCEVDGSKPNVMAAAWAMPIDFEPARVAIVVARGTLTRTLLETTRELVLNLPTVAQLDATFAVGSLSGRDVAKWTTYGLEMEKATRVRPPLVKGCAGWLECVLMDEEPVRERYDLVLCEVVAAWADDAVYFGREWHFEKRPEMRTLHHLARGTFFATGERLEAKKPEK